MPRKAKKKKAEGVAEGAVPEETELQKKRRKCKELIISGMAPTTAALKAGYTRTHADRIYNQKIFQDVIITVKREYAAVLEMAGIDYLRLAEIEAELLQDEDKKIRSEALNRIYRALGLYAEPKEKDLVAAAPDQHIQFNTLIVSKQDQVKMESLVEQYEKKAREVYEKSISKQAPQEPAGTAHADSSHAGGKQ